MKRDQVIRELCEIVKLVGDHFGNRFAHDCICSDADTTNFQFEEAVINFIRTAVIVRIAKKETT